MSSLILKRASASPPSGQRNDDDFDVLADGVVVGRIFNAAASPMGTPARPRRRHPEAGKRHLSLGYLASGSRCLRRER